MPHKLCCLPGGGPSRLQHGCCSLQTCPGPAPCLGNDRQCNRAALPCACIALYAEMPPTRGAPQACGRTEQSRGAQLLLWCRRQTASELARTCQSHGWLNWGAGADHRCLCSPGQAAAAAGLTCPSWQGWQRPWTVAPASCRCSVPACRCWLRSWGWTCPCGACPCWQPPPAFCWKRPSPRPRPCRRQLRLPRRRGRRPRPLRGRRLHVRICV